MLENEKESCTRCGKMGDGDILETEAQQATNDEKERTGGDSSNEHEQCYQRQIFPSYRYKSVAKGPLWLTLC